MLDSARGLHPVALGVLATCFTWGVTALGAALVFVVPRSLSQRRLRAVLDASLGFAAGVMLAASYWSLLAPAIESAESSGTYGAHAYAPVALGLMLGAGFVVLADGFIPAGADDAVAVLSSAREGERDSAAARSRKKKTDEETSEGRESSGAETRGTEGSAVRSKRRMSRQGSSTALGSAQRRRASPASRSTARASPSPDVESPLSPRAVVSASTPADDAGATAVSARDRAASWHRILLLVLAITIHNFPEGLAVGVGFGALQQHRAPALAAGSVTNASASAVAPEHAEAYERTYADACTLALGIGLQNFPEGLAVSLPLLRVGYSRSAAFFWGQLSGMVEPLGGLLGASLIGLMQPLLPYALSFAAGAMIFVVVDDLIPETHAPGGNPRLAAAFVMVGFCAMMAMDVGLG